MIARLDNGKIKIFSETPKVWGKHVNFSAANSEFLEAEGFYNVVKPDLNEGQKLGEIYFNSDDNIFTYHIEIIPEPTEEEQEKKNINKIKEKYESHEANGREFYRDFRADIVNDVLKGDITEPQAFQIEGVLNIAFDKISNSGDWKTAAYLLSQIDGLESFIAPYYNKAVEKINNYITINYV